MQQWQRNNLAASLCVFLLTAGFSFTIPFLPLYLEELEGISGEQASLWAGVATALGGIGSFVSGPIWGVLGDRLGRKPMLVRASLGGALGLFAFGLADTVWQVVAIRFFVGVMAGAPAAAMALIASSTPPEKLPQALGTFQASSLFGLAMGPAAAAALIELFDYRGTFFLTSSVMALGAVASMVLIREDRSTLLRGMKGQPGVGNGVRALLRVPVVRRTFLVAMALGLGVPMVQSVLAPFAKSLIGPETSVNLVVGGLFFGMSVCGGLAAILGGRLLRRTTTRRLLVVASLGAGLALLPQGAAQAMWQLAPFVLVMAFFQGWLQTATVALVSSVVSLASVSAGFGVYQSVQAASAQMAPAIGGVLAAWLGFRGVFPVAGVVLLAAGATAWRVLPDVRATGPVSIPEPAVMPAAEATPA